MGKPSRLFGNGGRVSANSGEGHILTPGLQLLLSAWCASKLLDFIQVTALAMSSQAGARVSGRLQGGKGQQVSMQGLPRLCQEPTTGGTKHSMQSLASAPKNSHASFSLNLNVGDQVWLSLATSRQLVFGCDPASWREQMMGMGAGGREGFVLVLAERREPGEAVLRETGMVCEEQGAGGQDLERGLDPAERDRCSALIIWHFVAGFDREL